MTEDYCECDKKCAICHKPKKKQSMGGFGDIKF